MESMDTGKIEYTRHSTKTIFLTHLVEWLCIMRYIGIGVHVPLIKIKLHFRYFSFPFKIAGRRKVR
jgi:hypothetical protein